MPALAAISPGGGQLVGLTLVDELQPKVLGADGDGGGLALGDDADAQATEARERDAEAVVGGEAFEFQAVPLAVGAGLAAVLGQEVELTVGEDAVDIEDEDFDLLGAGFSGKAHAQDDTGIMGWQVEEAAEALAVQRQVVRRQDEEQVVGSGRSDGGDEGDWNRSGRRQRRSKRWDECCRGHRPYPRERTNPDIDSPPGGRCDR